MLLKFTVKPPPNERHSNPNRKCASVIISAPGALTDVVVLVSGAELEAERERREELEFLREAQRPVGVLRPVTLPAFKAPHAVFAGGVALVVNHEEDVALHPAGRLRLLVVRTVHVQIVVDVHGDGVFSVPKPADRARNSGSVLSSFM